MGFTILDDNICVRRLFKHASLLFCPGFVGYRGSINTWGFGEGGVVNRQTRFFQPSSCLQIKWISPQLLMFKQFAFLVEDGAKLYSSYSSLLLHVIRFWGFRASLQKELIGEQVRFAATRLTLISFTLKSWNCLSEKYRHRSAEIWTLHRFTSFSIVLSTFATCCIRHR